MIENTVQLSPMEWAGLNDIHEVSPLNTNDEACLAEIRNVLLKHNKSDRFGVTLLHRHFDLSDDEMMMEFCDTKNRTLTTKPMKKTEVANSIETVWVFGNGKEEAARACYVSCSMDIQGNHARYHNASGVI